MQAETFGRTWLNMDLPFACELHWCTPQPSTRADVKRILVMFTEPLASLMPFEWVVENHRVFDLIFAYDRRLAALPNVVLMEFGSAWLDLPDIAKEFSVSFLLSTGGGTYDTRFPGHELRREVARAVKRYNAPVHIFMSSRGMALTPDQFASANANVREQGHTLQVLRETKQPLFASMFHICIENGADDYFFTEKIMDCFRTMTVPIYWGTSKISEFFDPEGIIIVKSADEINEVLKSLTPIDYDKRLDAMKRNYKLAENYLDPVARMKKIILERLVG